MIGAALTYAAIAGGLCVLVLLIAWLANPRGLVPPEDDDA